MKIEVNRQFEIAFPGPRIAAIAFMRDPTRSLAKVSFIKNLRQENRNIENKNILADLSVDVPFLGEQHLDFESELQDHEDGADLIALPRNGKAWAEVAGIGRSNNTGTVLHYQLQIVAHIELPAAEKWGGRAFTRMVENTAKSAIERMTSEFPRGVLAAIATKS